MRLDLAPLSHQWGYLLWRKRHRVRPHCSLLALILTCPIGCYRVPSAGESNALGLSIQRQALSGQTVHDRPLVVDPSRVFLGILKAGQAARAEFTIRNARGEAVTVVR